MRRWLGSFLPAVSLFSHAAAVPASDNFASMLISDLLHRDINDFDVDDLSFIKTIAAVGDSYSAGIGAGTLLARDYHGKTPMIDNDIGTK